MLFLHEKCPEDRNRKQRASNIVLLHLPRGMFALSWKMLGVIGGSVDLGQGPQISDTSNSPHYVDRKLDFLVKELRRLGVAVADIQETKWFGKNTWTADGYTLLHSGRTLPGEGDPQVRNEGVGILLDRHATVAWKNWSHRETASTFDCPCGRTFRRQGDHTRHSYDCSFSVT